MNRKGGYTIWLTGLSGSGKTTIARSLERKLKKKGIPLVMLDGDVVRGTLSNDLGYSKYYRDKHIIRVANVAYLVNASNIISIVCVISPTKKIRRFARSLIKNFVEIYVKCPLDVCESRDVKGLYGRVRNGSVSEFVGISIPYEKPINPEITVSTDRETLEESANKIMMYLEEREII